MYKKDSSGNWVEADKNSSGVYTVTDKTEPYKVTVAIVARNGIAPGVYTYSFGIPGADFSLIDGDNIMRAEGRTFGTYSVSGQQVTTTFENSNDLQGVRLQQNFYFDCSKVNDGIYWIKEIQVDIPEDPVPQASASKSGRIDAANLNWGSGLKTWDYLIPSSMKGTTFGANWNFKFEYRTDPEQTPQEAGHSLQFWNYFTGFDDAGTVKDTKVDWLIGSGKITKSVKYDTNFTNATWTIKATISSAGSNDIIAVTDGKTGRYSGIIKTLDPKYSPDRENIVVTLSYYENGAKKTVVVPADKSAASDGFYYTLLDGTWYSDEKGFSLWIHRDGENTGSGITASENAEATLTVTYKTPLTEEFLKYSKDINSILV